MAVHRQRPGDSPQNPNLHLRAEAAQGDPAQTQPAPNQALRLFTGSASLDASEPSMAVEDRGRSWSHLVKSLSTLGRQLRKALGDATGPHKLSDSEFLLLLGCGESAQGGLSQNELAQWLGASPGQVSGMVESLRRRGLLSKERCPHDRRRQLWTLTVAGGTLAESILRELGAAWSLSTDQPSTADQQDMQRLLSELEDLVNRLKVLAFQDQSPKREAA